MPIRVYRLNTRVLPLRTASFRVHLVTNREIVALQFSTQSLTCKDALGSSHVQSSRTSGWTSLLLDRHDVTPTIAEFDTLATPDQSIVVMLSGEQHLEVFSDGLWRRTVYRAGTVGLTPSGRTDRLRRCTNRQKAAFQKANIYLPQGLLDEAAEEFRQAGRGAPGGSLNALAFQDSMLCHVAMMLIKAMTAGASDLYAAATAKWLAVHLVCFHAGRLEPERLTLNAGSLTDRRIERVLELMSARLAEPLTLDELATEAGVSKFHFVRLFREKVGATPHAILVRFRLEAAQSMLAASDLEIGTIAGLCGYGRGSELAAAFRQRFGVTPLTWRAEANRSRPAGLRN